MLNIRNVVTDLSDVPSDWIFSTYLNLSEHLYGQDLKISSPFSIDSNPSFHVRLSRQSNRYGYIDYSTGKNGDGISLVQELFKLKTRGDASNFILKEYRAFLEKNKVSSSTLQKEYIHKSKYRVTDFSIRKWNILDKEFWTTFHIGTKSLNFFVIKPISGYLLKNDSNEFWTKGEYIYGYFKQDGTLYKIYQPKIKERKCIKVCDYIQGIEQLKFNTDNLVLLSSLKDTCGFHALNIPNYEAIAPDSENTLINHKIMCVLIKRYKKTIILFDNDRAGLEAAQKYKEIYKDDVSIANLEMAKDLTDSMRDFGIKQTRKETIDVLGKC